MNEEKILFAISDIDRFQDDENQELAIAKIHFLSTAKNTHKINITEELLRRDAKTALNKFVVGEMNWMEDDVKGHEENQQIFGFVPKDQEVQFETLKNGVVVASVDAIVSKIYATSFYDIFVKDNMRSVSVEMMVRDKTEMPDGSYDISGFNICGITALAKKIAPSCPDAHMSIVRFSEDEANKFYQDHKENCETMAEEENYENHPIDTSKEAMVDEDWDGDKAKQDLVKEEKYTTLAKKVCLRLDDGWEDREVTKLGYPVMGLYEGKWVYYKKALASAKSYATQHGDDDVLAKVNKLYKKLDLEDSEEKEETAKMSEIEKIESETNVESFEEKPAVENEVDENKVDEKMAEDSEKDAAEVADDNAESNVSEEEMSEDEPSVEEPDYKALYEEEMSKCAQLQSDIESKCDIIMSYEKELDELRKFKEETENSKKDVIVAATLSKIKGKINEKDYEAFEKSGSSCTFEDVNAWKNTVFATVGEQLINFSESNADDGIMRMEIPAPEKPKGLWD